MQNDSGNNIQAPVSSEFNQTHLDIFVQNITSAIELILLNSSTNYSQLPINQTQFDPDELTKKLMHSFKEILESAPRNNVQAPLDQNILSEILKSLSASQSITTQDPCKDKLGELKTKTNFLDVFDRQFKNSKIIADLKYSIVRPLKVFFTLMKAQLVMEPARDLLLTLVDDVSSDYAEAFGELGDKNLPTDDGVNINTVVENIISLNGPYIQEYFKLDKNAKSPIEVKTVKAIKNAMNDIWKDEKLKGEIQEYCASSCVFQKFSSDDELAVVGICGLYHVESQQNH